MRVTVYARISTEKQNEGESLDTQVARCRAYAGLYGHTIVDVVTEVASAKNLDRPELRRALVELAAGRIDALLVVKLDRLTRSIRDLCSLVESHFTRKGALLSVGEQIDTSTASGRVVLNILTSIGQWERETIGERTKAVIDHQKAMGTYCGGTPNYGTQVVPGLNLGDSPLHVPHPEEQAILALVRGLRAKGARISTILETVNARGHLSRKGRPFQRTQIVNMLVTTPGGDAIQRA